MPFRWHHLPIWLQPRALRIWLCSFSQPVCTRSSTPLYLSRFELGSRQSTRQLCLQQMRCPNARGPGTTHAVCELHIHCSTQRLTTTQKLVSGPAGMPALGHGLRPFRFLLSASGLVMRSSEWLLVSDSAQIYASHMSAYVVPEWTPGVHMGWLASGAQGVTRVMVCSMTWFGAR